MGYFFVRKHIKWTKHSLNHEMLMLLRREILLIGKYIEREVYALYVQHFGTELF